MSTQTTTAATSAETEFQLSLLDLAENNAHVNQQKIAEYSSAPFVSTISKRAAENTASNLSSTHQTSQLYPQYGLLGAVLQNYGPGYTNLYSPFSGSDPTADRLLYHNTNVPFSTFICGSQGSGKSHTLSCMLENCLLKHKYLGRLQKPVAGMVLHYDTFSTSSSAEACQPCEAAYLCTSGIKVRVLVSPSNYHRMKALYENLPDLALEQRKFKPTVIPLQLGEAQLNIKRMLTLMGADEAADGRTPLYMHIVRKILRDMAGDGQTKFSYPLFKASLEDQPFTKDQETPLALRLEMLESFLDSKLKSSTRPLSKPKGKAKSNPSEKAQGSSAAVPKGPKAQQFFPDRWSFNSGTLTIVDLSCPFVDEVSACIMFSICVGIFMESNSREPRVLALDEAHKVS
jgi:hypothetical protein